MFEGYPTNPLSRKIVFSLIKATDCKERKYSKSEEKNLELFYKSFYHIKVKSFTDLMFY